MNKDQTDVHYELVS